MDKNVLTLDFETYYDTRSGYTLRKMSTPEYVADPRFKIEGIALRYPDGAKEFNTQDPAACIRGLQEKYGENFEKVILLCHNFPFDGFILAKKFGIIPKLVLDTKYLAYVAFGKRERLAGGQDASLKGLALRLGLQPKGDLKFMDGAAVTAENRAEYEAYALHDVELTYQILQRLAPMFSRPEVELPILNHTLRLWTERGVKVDLEGLAKLRKQIQNEAQDYFKKAGKTPEELSGSKSFQTAMAEALARTNRKLPMKHGKKGPIPALAKTDPAMQDFLEDDDSVVRCLAAARLNKKSSDSQVARLDKMERMARANGGILPVGLAYYGARTGRWSGEGGLNLQNMGRKGFGGKIRELLVARPGHKLVIADLAQIEARVLAFLAGESDLVEQFRRNEDVYSIFAARAFHREVRKPRKDDSPEKAAELTTFRQVGKKVILGLGYSMGAIKFLDQCRADPDISPLFDSGILSPQIVKGLVDTYRGTFPGIVNFWKECQDTFKLVVVGGGAGSVGDHGLLFKRSRLPGDLDTVLLRLPSGRVLRYPDARVETKSRTLKTLDEVGETSVFEMTGDALTYDNKNGAEPVHIYGGKIVENIVQAVSRDILAEAILRMEKRGFPILLHVHDEIVAEVLETNSEDALKAMQEELNREPEWARGAPLGCEANIAGRYGK